VLAGLIKKVDRSVRAVSIGSLDALDTVMGDKHA
jgi:hypothetical protein